MLVQDYILIDYNIQYTYKVNKNIPNSIQEYIQGMKKALLDNGYDQTKMEDPEYRNRWQKYEVTNIFIY